MTESRGKQTVQKQANEWKEKSRNKSRVEKGTLKVRKDQSTWELQSCKRKIESDPENGHTNELKRKKTVKS